MYVRKSALKHPQRSGVKLSALSVHFPLITSNTYYDWSLDHIFLLVPAQAGVAEFLKTFKEFPPRQKAASFSIDQVMEKMTEAASGGHR